jgi:PTS system mannose-specific IIB component
MPVLATRVDQKLIHGQVTLGWAAVLEIEEIVVADESALESELLMDIMTVGVQPPVKKACFVAPAELPSFLREKKTQDPRMMILFRDVPGVKEALDAGLLISSLNLGNQFPQPSQESFRLADSFYVGREDLLTLTDLAKGGLVVFFQSLPADPKIQFDPNRYRWTR